MTFHKFNAVTSRIRLFCIFLILEYGGNLCSYLSVEFLIPRISKH